MVVQPTGQAEKTGKSLFRRARIVSAGTVGFLILLVVAAVVFDAWRTYRHDFAEAKDSLRSVSRLLRAVPESC